MASYYKYYITCCFLLIVAHEHLPWLLYMSFLMAIAQVYIMVYLTIPLFWGITFFLILVTLSSTLTNIPAVKSLNPSMVSSSE